MYFRVVKKIFASSFFTTVLSLCTQAPQKC